MSELETIWHRIERAIGLLEPPVEGTLPGGASADALAKLQEHLPVPVPRELRESLACHDGVGSVALEELPPLLSVEEIIEEYDRLSHGVEGVHGPVPFRPEWIPFEAFGGVWLLIDASNALDTNPIICVAVENASAIPLPGSLTQLLANTADELEAMVPEQETVDDSPAWSLRLVENLIASGDLLLNSDADANALANRLDEVASKDHGGKHALAEALLDALVDAPEVDEVFAAPETIMKALADIVNDG